MIDNCIKKFTNCSILRNNEIIKEDLWVRNGKIINPEPLFFEEKIGPDETIDCGGVLVAPGLIDLQINGGFGVDFSVDMKDEKSVKECIRKVAKGLLAHGKGSFLLSYFYKAKEYCICYVLYVQSCFILSILHCV